MPWIDQVEEADAQGPVQAMYDAARKRAGRVANILKLMSLDPGIAKASMDFYIAIMHAPGALDKARREMLATVVSNTNDCYY